MRLVKKNVKNLDYSLGQHYKQLSKKSELPDLTQGLSSFRPQGCWEYIRKFEENGVFYNFLIKIILIRAIFDRPVMI